LTGELLLDIVQRIASNPQVRRIILFGSYASPDHTPNPDSDIDLLVIMDTPAPPAERILAISSLLRPRPFPMDILVRTPQEMYALLERGDDFFLEITKQGKVLFER
jgi:predicted nucleotidyltransferase